MKVTYLGTGTSQGVPVIACRCPVCTSGDTRDQRLRSSVLVEEDNRVFLIDTSPDFRQQMLREGVSRLDAILFTHAHRDHIAGLDDIRAYNFLLRKPMDVYAEERVARALMHEFPYIFAERKYPGIPQVKVNIIDTKPFDIDGISIIPVRAMHYRLPVLGFRIGDFAYITDANHIPGEEMSKLAGLKVLTICALRKKEHISHFNLSQALEIIKLVNPEVACLTHIGHQMGLHAEVQQELPEGVSLAWDGLSISL
jgi:phosphoribosyl 1,2-cyclic phosphate phosphodiesterase